MAIGLVVDVLGENCINIMRNKGEGLDVLGSE